MSSRIDVVKRCRVGHETRHAVTKPGAVHCRTCGVSVWISRADLEAASGGSSPARAAERRGLDAWWDSIAKEREAAAPSYWRAREAADPADGGRACPTCGEPMRWAGGYTALVCIRHKPAAWRRDAAALARAGQYLGRNAPKADGGPSPTEAAEVAEWRALVFDEITGAREQLARIPRGDDWRQDAVLGLHKLEQLEGRCKDARTYADVDVADAEYLELLGGTDEAGKEQPGKLADVLRHAEKIAAKITRAERRRERGGVLAALLHGDTYEYVGEGEQEGEQLGAEQTAAEAPPCDICLQGFQERPAVKRAMRPGSLSELNVCGEHWRGFGPGARVVADYASAGRQLTTPAGRDYFASWDAEATARARALGPAPWKPPQVINGKQANGGRQW